MHVLRIQVRLIPTFLVGFWSKTTYLLDIILVFIIILSADLLPASVNTDDFVCFIATDSEPENESDCDGYEAERVTNQPPSIIEQQLHISYESGTGKPGITNRGTW